MIKHLYNRSFALQDIKFRRRLRTPTFLLALVHISLICSAKLRSSSIVTPRSLICFAFTIFRSCMLRVITFFSLSTLLGFRLFCFVFRLFVKYNKLLGVPLLAPVSSHYFSSRSKKQDSLPRDV